MPVTLRAARPGDVDTILRFIRELAAFEQLSHEVLADRDLLELHLFGARPAAEVVLAERGAEPVGFALFFTNFSTFLARPGLYLEDLYVTPAHRGAGIGEALLVHLAQIARQRGYGRFEWAVLDWNAGAMRFYERLGARRIDEWRIFRVTGSALAALAARSPG